ncbi:hypothetical protein ACFO9Q_15600 [Paenibacillus sp. GCM10023252]|uniref:hypothetical protein n=1 Tax=Paenibacillus sp. GCM10023252 TaxID=3252649 RepID=UPI0036100BFA
MGRREAVRGLLWCLLSLTAVMVIGGCSDHLIKRQSVRDMDSAAFPRSISEEDIKKEADGKDHIVLEWSKGDQGSKHSSVNLPLAQSGYYQPLREVSKVTYSKPVRIRSHWDKLPSMLTEAVRPLDTDELPWKAGEELAYVASFEKDGKRHQQVQLTYLQDMSSGAGDEFIILRMTELAEDPWAAADIAAADTFDNPIKVHKLGGKRPVTLYHHILATDSSYTYQYYNYNDAMDRVDVTVSAANEINFYSDGILYQVGYHLDGDHPDQDTQDRMVKLVESWLDGT